MPFGGFDFLASLRSPHSPKNVVFWAVFLDASQGRSEANFQRGERELSWKIFRLKSINFTNFSNFVCKAKYIWWHGVKNTVFGASTNLKEIIIIFMPKRSYGEIFDKKNEFFNTKIAFLGVSNLDLFLSSSEWNKNERNSIYTHTHARTHTGCFRVEVWDFSQWLGNTYRVYVCNVCLLMLWATETDLFQKKFSQFRISFSSERSSITKIDRDLEFNRGERGFYLDW